jgi:intracellular septation protein A
MNVETSNPVNKTSVPPPANPWVELLITIVAPSLVLMQGNAYLGPVATLLLALALPLGWGLWQVTHQRSFGLMASIGVVSTLLTGGIGLMALDVKWLAIKEAAVPAVLGLVVAGSAWTRRPLINALIFNPNLFDVERVHKALAERNTEAQFEQKLRSATLMLSGTFFFSAVMNYILARWLVSSPTGSDAFNEELGRLTLLSYPMIALPSLGMMVWLLLWLGRCSKELAGLDLMDMMRAPPPK